MHTNFFDKYPIIHIKTFIHKIKTFRVTPTFRKLPYTYLSPFRKRLWPSCSTQPWTKNSLVPLKLSSNSQEKVVTLYSYPLALHLMNPKQCPAKLSRFQHSFSPIGIYPWIVFISHSSFHKTHTMAFISSHQKTYIVVNSLSFSISLPKESNKRVIYLFYSPLTGDNQLQQFFPL